jgi:uracil phosphoribosyltransferase
MEPGMARVVELSHPLVKHHLAQMRNEQTRPEEFRRLVSRLATILAYQATSDLELEPIRVKTPLVETAGERLSQSIGLVPILRAGLGMVDPLLELVPTAGVWHLGMYRDEQTATPVEYYSKLEGHPPVDVALVLDPMLATGGSAVAALRALSRWGVPRLKLLSIIAAPEGVEAVGQHCPDVEIHVCVIDECLNDVKFIVPGLGDAGDRIFNT